MACSRGLTLLFLTVCLLAAAMAGPAGRGAKPNQQRRASSSSRVSTNEHCRHGLFVHSSQPHSLMSLLCPPKVNCSRWAPPGTSRDDIRCVVKQLDLSDPHSTDPHDSLVYQFACGTVQSCSSKSADAGMICYLAIDALDLAAKHYPVIAAEPSTEVVAINCA